MSHTATLAANIGIHPVKRRKSSAMAGATGDIGYTDEEGYLYIVDRKKGMIEADTSPQMNRVSRQFTQIHGWQGIAEKTAQQ